MRDRARTSWAPDEVEICNRFAALGATTMGGSDVGAALLTAIEGAARTARRLELELEDAVAARAGLVREAEAAGVEGEDIAAALAGRAIHRFGSGIAAADAAA